MDYSFIKNRARFKALGDSTNTKFSNDDCDEISYEAYLEALAICFHVDGDWQIIGTYAYLDIADDTYKYHLDDIVWIDTVEFKTSPDDEKYSRSTKIDPSFIIEDLENYTPSSPQHDVRGDYLLLFKSTAFEATTKGIKVRIEDLPSAFSADTDIPKIPKPFIKFIYTYMAWQYCLGKEKWAKADRLEKELYGRNPEVRSGGIKASLEEWMANRSESKLMILEPFQENFE